MSRFLDKSRKRIKGIPITFIGIFICIGVIASLIIHIMRIRKNKGISISDRFRNADERYLNYQKKDDKVKYGKLLYDLRP